MSVSAVTPAHATTGVFELAYEPVSGQQVMDPVLVGCTHACLPILCGGVNLVAVL